MGSKRKRQNIAWAFGMLAAILLTIIAGSGGQIRLNDRMLIQGIGVDMQGEQVLVSAHVSQSTKEGKILLQQAEGSTVLEALDKLVQKSGKIPLYSHNMVVVLGKSCAESGVEGVLDFFVRYYETRPSVSLFLSDGKASELFEYQENGEHLDAEDLVRIGHSGAVNGWSVNVRVIDFVNQLKGAGTAAYLPVLTCNQDGAEVVKTGVFRGDRYEAAFSPEESRVLLLLTDGLYGGQMVAEIPECGKVTFSFQTGTASIESTIEDGVPHFSVFADCEMEISSMDLMNPSRNDLIPDMEKTLEEQLTKQIQDTIQRSTGELHADPFGFGRLLMQRESNWWKANGENWENWMGKSVYEVESDIKVNRVEQEITPIY